MPIHYLLKVLLLFLFAQTSFAQTVHKNNNFFEEITYELVNGKILIPVEIQGKAFKFFFDTGGLLVISPRLKEQLNLRSVDSGTVSGVNKVKTKTDVVKIDQVKIGSLQFNNRKAIVSAIMERHPVTCLEADGIIGRDFLKNMAIQFDQRSNKIVLTDQPHRLNLDRVKAQILQFTNNKIPILGLNVNGKNIKKVIFDSGSDDFLSFKTKSIQKYRKRKVYSKNDIVELYGNFSLGISGIYPAPEKQYHVFIKELEFAGTKFKAFHTDISKNSHNRIGTELLNHGVLTLDYINKNFYFQVYEDQHDLKLINSYGFMLRITDQNAIVSGVFSDGPAAKKGIEIGQKILSINNTMLSNLSHSQRCEFYKNNYPWFGQYNIEVKVLNKFGQIKMLNLELFKL